MVKGLKSLMIILSVVIVIVAYLAFAQSYKTVTPSVTVETYSESLKAFWVFDVSSDGYYTYVSTAINDLTQFNFGPFPPGAKFSFYLVLTNFGNVTIHNITQISTLSEITTHITEEIIIYRSGRLSATYSSSYRFTFSYPLTSTTWPVSLAPKEAVLIKCYIKIATSCPVNTTYSWTWSFIPA
ncbi:MAG: hypothetical protein QXF61_11345 [Nitrososphaeria archaeon]